jgi:hypothetical protein
MISTFSKRCRLLTTSLLIACIRAHAQTDEAEQDAKTNNLIVKDYLGKERTLHDGDGDGWDDLWCHLHPDLKHRNKSIDTDGDKLTDYEEMILWRDPYVEGPLPHDPTPQEIEEAQRVATESLALAQDAWEKKKAEAAPLLRQLLPPGQSDPDAGIVKAEEDSSALRRAAAASKLLTAGDERTLDDLARKHGVAKVLQDEDGKIQKLAGESLGPIYIQENDTLSAAGISADELWPIQNDFSLPGYFPWPYRESHAGLNLSGAGEILGMWEVGGGVRPSHIEMGVSRIFQKDTATFGSSGHATNVAGTMAGSGAATFFGDFYESRGVAYGASVFAYDTDSFASERASAAAGSVTDPPVRLSNHSWSVNCGWQREDIDSTAGTNLQWVWYGSTDSSFQEDQRFGSYLPDNGLSFGSAQIDLFLQSQAPRHLMVFSCGNNRQQGPAVSPGTYYYRLSSTTWQSVDATAIPRDWSDGDTGFYDSIAPPGTSKNVLTVGSCDDVFRPNGSNFAIVFGSGSLVNASSFSGAGPTDDGRIKPDLVAIGSPDQTIRQPLGLMYGNPSLPVILAPHSSTTIAYSLGVTGTSFAAPAVTGALGLVIQRRRQLYPDLPESQAWLGSTLKAIAINTCDDAEAEGPDYRLGYGVMNARSAALAVDADHASGRGSLIKEFSLAPGESASWVVQNDGTQPLAVTVPWSDPPGPAPTPVTVADAQSAMLINNLDLKVEYLGPDTTALPPPTEVISTFLPWTLDPDLSNKSATTRALAAVRGVDDRNNVEKVSISSPMAGRYRITVTHSGGISGNPAPSTQVVSAALSGVTSELPTITSVAASPTATEFILSFTADPGAFFTIQSSPDLEVWTDEGSVLAEAVTNSLIVTSDMADTKLFWRMRRGQ